tara:strand:+ start:294 stop:569 length:276 start_codon:yes stop_codon:yes gene_type:complete
MLEYLRDAVFRERGTCVHPFFVVNSRSLAQGSAGRDIAVREATVHSFRSPADPRTPGGPVQAVVKWMNDDVDETGKSLAVRYARANHTASS